MLNSLETNLRYLQRVTKEPTKMTAREHWKKIYRALRIARRESMKAAHDLMIFGTGIVRVDSQGNAKHVPIKEYFDKSAEARAEENDNG